MQHYTQSKYVICTEGREFWYTNELGLRVAVARDGCVFTPRRGVTRGSKRGRGYYGITVDNHTVYVHQLVYEVFVERIPEGMEIDHINADPYDNRVENLRVVTKSGNMRNPITRKRNLVQLGSVRGKAVEARRRKVRAVWTDEARHAAASKDFNTVTAAAEFTGVDRTSIAKVCTGRRHSAKGFKFYYVEGDVCDRYHK